MNASLFRLELRRVRMIVLWLAVIVLAYGGVMAAFYPVMTENTALIDEYMNVFPKEYLAAFGIAGSLSDPGIFFTTYIGSWLWPIIAAMAGVTLGSRPVAADHERGWIELPLATPVSRGRYLVSAIGGQAVAMAVLAVAAVAGFQAVAYLVDAPFDAGRLFLVAIVAWVFGCAIAAITTLVSVITLSRSTTAGIVVAVLLAMYLTQVVAQIQPNLDWLGNLSAFTYFKPTPIVDEGAFPVSDFAVFAVVTVLGWGLALVAFRRRDLAA